MNSSFSIDTYACTRLGGMKNVKNVKKPKPLRSFTLFMFFTLSGRMHACGPRGARLADSRGRGSFPAFPDQGNSHPVGRVVSDLSFLSVNVSI